MRKRLRRFFSLLVIAGLLIGTVSGCGGDGADKITVGSQNYTENILLGEIMAQLIDNKTDLKVERKLNLGGTLVAWEALKKGDLDLYPEYTGTALMAILKKEVMYDADEVYNLVQKEYNEQFQVKWLKPFGFNNTYATAVTREMAEKYNLVKTSDLKPYAKDLVFCAEQEFFNRDDGYDGFVKTYNLQFKDKRAVETALKYQAVAEGKVQVIDAFSTDGELVTYDMVILEDDKGFFPPYHGAPIIRMDTLEKYPELEEVLNLLAGQISDTEMQQLNYQVKEQKKDAAEVATKFLQDKGLI